MGDKKMNVWIAYVIVGLGVVAIGLWAGLSRQH